MAAQLSREARLSRADDIAINNGDLAYLHLQLDELHQKYLQLSR